MRRTWCCPASAASARPWPACARRAFDAALAARVRDRPGDACHVRRPPGAVRDERREPRRHRHCRVSGRVGRFPEAVRVPQFGWNRVEPEPGCSLIEPGYAYFANSYRVLEAPGCAVATAEHGGRFVAALERGRRAGLPVPSGAVGRVRSGADRALAGSVMLTARIIPCLDVSHGRVVKGIRFQGLRDAGDPAERAALYERQGADEIVILDVSATPEAPRQPGRDRSSACARACAFRSRSAAASARSTMRAPCSRPAPTRSRSTPPPCTARHS